MTHVPVTLHHLGVAPADKTPSFDGVLIRIEVDARMDSHNLIEMLFSDPRWPAKLSDDEVEQAINDCIDSDAIEHYTKLFASVHPEEAPEDYHIRVHPRIDDMWLVIGPDYDIMGSWSTYGEALCEAWELESQRTGKQEVTPQYAHFDVRVPTPEGYYIGHSDDLLWFYNRGPDGNTADEHGFDTQIDACIAAWHDKLAQADSTVGRLVKGDTYTPLGTPEHRCAGIHWQPVAGGEPWLNRIEVHGTSAADAQALRDRLLASMTALDEIHQLLNDQEWDSDTPNDIAQVVQNAGYVIRDPLMDNA